MCQEGININSETGDLSHMQSWYCTMFGLDYQSLPMILIIQVNEKFCELKGGNIGIVEKAQETRFAMSPKYSRYIGIAS